MEASLDSLLEQFSFPEPILLVADRTLSGDEVTSFQEAVLRFAASQTRSFPWRNGVTPYKVFVSEVMLQQTQTSRVAEKFPQFIKQFPSFKRLAEASQTELLTAWQGLGYNRRALNLQRAAKEVWSTWRGRLPKTKEQLIALPGIGEYTSSSIPVFAFDSPEIVIETNIRAVCLYFYFHDSDEVVSEAQFREIVEAVLLHENPSDWYNALMDLGTLIKAACPGITRRAKIYRKQSTFKGSRRQARGEALRLLLKQQTVTKKQVIKATSKSEEEALLILEQLTREGFCKKSGQRWVAVES